MQTKKILSWLGILLFSLATPLIVLFLSEQESFLQNVFLFILLFIMVSTILILLCPMINGPIVEKLGQKWLYYPFLAFLLIFPLSNWVFIENFFQYSKLLWGTFALWYVVPVVIMTLPTLFMKLDRIRPLFFICGVIILAIGFDNRNTNILLSGFNDIGYIFNSLWVSALLLVIISIQYDDFLGFFNWEIQSKKFILPLTILLCVGVVILPIGLLTGFIVWAPMWDGVGMLIVTFLGIWFTIALPEELIARGVVQHQLMKFSRDNVKKFEILQITVVILISSFIFGVSHWNNTTADFVWIYIGLATVAGIGFGWCWQKSGLFSSMLLHTSIDFVWAMCFGG
ncbi:CPBP family glutamic-type intramembrane protease [Candidatus Lokiarchaeum ossiferum]|uniref:CPBP family glutamic-type intramembrane protease n=1 Tax=Candidatus Lokiarchaeum ossiferum TaxID=2951803 RepID=UPI00352C090F